MDGWIVIPNWSEFQHYKNRDPVWIKNYVSLLQNPAYLGLTMHQTGVLHRLWLAYAASHHQITVGQPRDRRQTVEGPPRDRWGTVDSTASVARQVGGRVTAETLRALNHAGFVQVSASKPLAPRYYRASPEVEVRVKEKEAGASSAAADAAASANSKKAELWAAANRYAAGWNGGTSDTFDEGLDELEYLTGARLEAGDRYRLWDKALHLEQHR